MSAEGRDMRDPDAPMSAEGREEALPQRDLFHR
jgi:hypothetical protein